MYGTLALTRKALEDHRAVAGDAAVDEIRRLAEPLQGLRVLHLSVTAFGTGVAELLGAAVPLISDVGVDCRWQVVRPTEESAAANKALYRALAGAQSDWSPEMSELWLRYSAMNAELLNERLDVIVVHDPQPAAIRAFVADAARQDTRWVLHSHLDLSSARQDAWDLLRAYIEPYDAIVFDSDTFLHADLRDTPVTIIRPAIDPLGPRNMELGSDAIETILCRYGIDPQRPIICQMSPCDPASDLLGAMHVHRLVQRHVPDAQLVLVAMYPPEDAASVAYLDEVVRESAEHPDVHILRGATGVGNVEANALQRAADVMIQKGLRKGFGIWIADAQWKRRPVVSIRAGGLAQQVLDGETGYLAQDPEEFADRIVALLQDRVLAGRLGDAGHARVAEHFLLTRFVADELRLLGTLARQGP